MQSAFISLSGLLMEVYSNLISTSSEIVTLRLVCTVSASSGGDVRKCSEFGLQCQHDEFDSQELHELII